MPKVPRPRHRHKSTKAKAKLSPEQRSQLAQEVLPDRWRNSGGSKGSSDLPKEAERPAVRRRYGAVLPAVPETPAQKKSRSDGGGSPPAALRYYEYTLLGKHDISPLHACATVPVTYLYVAVFADAGPAGEDCFLFHVVQPDSFK